ncbi:MAG: MurR/RpiR family transcriptional regulator [Neisseriaceae bacterium]|nr:MurR/RpiR family transcriptional regulator [Neisseriaceae bacterium]
MNEQSIEYLLRIRFDTLSPTEKKVARILIQQYPIAGLETIAQLAQKAAVSGPTVLRLITKLGFGGYNQFQEALRTELAPQRRSPLARRQPNMAIPPHDFLNQYADNLKHLIDQTMAQLLPADFETTVALLGHPKYRLWLIGGHITGPIAEYFGHHLQAIRPNVGLLRPMSHTWMDALVDMGKHDVLVIFDIRRYWPELHPLAQQARAQKSHIVLVTDQWQSPLHTLSNVTLIAHTEGHSGWDTNVSIMALVDALIAALNNQDWHRTKARLEQIERLRLALQPPEQP